MLWVKAVHIVFMVSWLAGLLYLPRLFVYHSMTEDRLGLERFKAMERRLYYGIMMPAMLLTFATGIWMLFDYAWGTYGKHLWLHLKLGLVVLLLLYHFLCGYWMNQFAAERNSYSHRFFRIVNELPWLLLFGITVLVIVKPWTESF